VLIVFFQELVNKFGHMSTISTKKKCSVCKQLKTRTEYDGSQWMSKQYKKRECGTCKSDKKVQLENAQPVA